MPKMIPPEPGAIKTMEPEELLKCFRPLVYKIAMKYLAEAKRLVYVDCDDLLQTGYIALIEAQKAYNPDKNSSFIPFAYKLISFRVMRLLGWRWMPEEKQMKFEPTLYRLDAPISEDDPDGMTLVDMIQDPDALPIDESIIEDETRRETSEQVRAALDRMKSDKQRTAVKLVWLDGKKRTDAAAEMEMNRGAFYMLEKSARSTLRRDYRLRKYAHEMPFIHVSVTRFNTTWTSATEYAALWRITHLPESSPEPVTPESTSDKIR